MDLLKQLNPEQLKALSPEQLSVFIRHEEKQSKIHPKKTIIKESVEKVTCPCGKTFRESSQRMHNKTVVHREYLIKIGELDDDTSSKMDEFVNASIVESNSNIICPCGSIVTKMAFRIHKQTKPHIDRICKQMRGDD